MVQTSQWLSNASYTLAEKNQNGAIQISHDYFYVKQINGISIQ